MRVLSPRIDPPDRALDGSTASTATRCPSSIDVLAEAVDERGLADAGRAADADADRAAGRRRSTASSRSTRLGAVVGARRLDQGDRPRRAPADRRPSPARASRTRACQATCLSGLPNSSRSRTRPRGLGDVGAGTEDGGHPGVVQEVVVLRRDDAAAHDEDVAGARRLAARRSAAARASCAPRPGSRRRRRARRSRPRRGPPRPAFGTAGRRRRRSRGRRTRWRSPWRLGRARPGPSWRRGCAGRRPSALANASTRLRICGELLVVLVRRSVHAGDGADLGAVAAEHLLHRIGHLADGGSRPGRLDAEREQVAVAAAPVGRARRARPATAASSRAAAAARGERSAARAPRRCRCRACRRGRASLEPVLVDADDDLVAAVDRGLAARGRLLDAQLRHARLDRLRHAAEPLDLLDQRPTPRRRARA